MAQVSSESSTTLCVLPHLLAQEAARQASLALVRKLRREARDEIAKLIELLDSTDEYVIGELEDDGDEADASYPTSGAHVANPMEDDEDSDADEDSDPGEYDDTGIGDADGLMEQCPERFAYCDVRVEA